MTWSRWEFPTSCRSPARIVCWSPLRTSPRHPAAPRSGGPERGRPDLGEDREPEVGPACAPSERRRTLRTPPPPWNSCWPAIPWSTRTTARLLDAQNPRAPADRAGDRGGHHGGSRPDFTPTRTTSSVEGDFGFWRHSGRGGDRRLAGGPRFYRPTLILGGDGCAWRGSRPQHRGIRPGGGAARVR